MRTKRGLIVNATLKKLELNNFENDSTELLAAIYNQFSSGSSTVKTVPFSRKDLVVPEILPIHYAHTVITSLALTLCPLRLALYQSKYLFVQSFVLRSKDRAYKHFHKLCQLTNAELWYTLQRYDCPSLLQLKPSEFSCSYGYRFLNSYWTVQHTNLFDPKTRVLPVKTKFRDCLGKGNETYQYSELCTVER